MIIELDLKKEHIKLIPFFFTQEINDDVVGVDRMHLLCLGSSLLEDMAMILGLNDKAIANTQDDAEGRAYDSETEKFMLDIYDYISKNMYYIETLIHQFVVKGGIVEGKYRAYANELLWKKIE